MFSHNLYEALCQSEVRETPQPQVQEDEATMLAAIQRAMESYQRLYAQRTQNEL